MADLRKHSDRNRPDDQRPGRLPYIVSTRGNLIWCCKVSAQPVDVRLVLRASADGQVWASIGTVEAEAAAPSRQRDDAASRKKRERPK